MPSGLLYFGDMFTKYDARVYMETISYLWFLDREDVRTLIIKYQGYFQLYQKSLETI